MARSRYYEESETVKRARKNLEDQQGKRPGSYRSDWQPVLDAAIDKLRGRRDFSYDATGDALYRQYKDQYLRGGRQAMVDTAASASARTGGYGSSYAQTAAQQAYGEYMAGLAAKIPELYKLALDRYSAEGDELQRQLNAVSDREKTDYDRWRDGVGDWETENKRLTEAYTDARDFDRALSRDAAADDKWLQELEEEKRQFNIRYGDQGKSGGKGGKGSSKKEEKELENQFDALAAWCRDQKVAGASRDTLLARINEAYIRGEISQGEMFTLRSWYGTASGSLSRDKETGNKLLQSYVR